MKAEHTITTALILLVALAISGICAGADMPTDSSGEKALTGSDASIAGSPWRFNANVYFWFVDAPLKLKKDGETIADLDEDLDTILKSLEFGAMFEVEAHKGPLGLFVSPIFYKGEYDDHIIGPLGRRRKFSVKETVWLIDYGVSYKVGRWPLGKNSDTPALTVEPYAGFRYLHDNIQTKIHSDGALPGITEHFTIEFNTPIVGARTSWELSDRWRLSVIGDYGGWDVDHVDETYQGMAMLGYRFTMWDKPATAFAGYRYLSIQYSKAVDFDLDIHGPLIGIGWEL
jgi:hypothetical protein